MKEHSRPEINAMNPSIDFHNVSRVALTLPEFYPDGARPGFWSREIVIEDHQGGTHRIHLFAPTRSALTLAHEQTPEPQGETK